MTSKRKRRKKRPKTTAARPARPAVPAAGPLHAERAWYERTNATENAKTPGPRIVGYVRVSTDEQNPDLQRRALEGYAATKGVPLMRVYEDLGYSGADDQRPGLRELWRAANAQAFDVLVVWKFDRLSRSTMELLDARHFFESLKIDLVSLTEGVDTTTPAGRLVFTVIAALAEFERSVTIERIQAGVAAYREKHGVWGRRWALDDATLADAKAMQTAGMPLRAIARQLKRPRTTLRRALGRRR